MDIPQIIKLLRGMKRYNINCDYHGFAGRDLHPKGEYVDWYDVEDVIRILEDSEKQRIERILSAASGK